MPSFQRGVCTSVILRGSQIHSKLISFLLGSQRTIEFARSRTQRNHEREKRMALRDTIKVMIVDDMSVSRGLLTQALEEMGIKNIEFAKSGDAALQSLVANPAHLVISDYNMPGPNGLDLLQGLRQNRTTQSIGFILVSGSPAQEMLTRGQTLGLNNFVKKPFTTVSLKAAVEAVVGRL